MITWFLIVILFHNPGSNSATASSFAVPMRNENACMTAFNHYYEKYSAGADISCLNTTTGISIEK